MKRIPKKYNFPSCRVFLFCASFLIFLCVEMCCVSLGAQAALPPQTKSGAGNIVKEEDMESLYKDAKLLYRKKDYRNAKSKFEKIISIDPEYPGAKRYLASIEEELKKAGPSEKPAAKASTIRKKPIDEKREKEIIRKLEEVKREEIDSAYRQGKEFYKDKKYEDAKIKFEETLRLDPAHKGVVEYIKITQAKIEEIKKKEEKDTAGIPAKAKEEKGIPKEAVPEAQKRLDELNSIYQKGKEYYKTKKYEDAKVEFEKVLKIDPAHKGAFEYLKITKAKIEELKKKEEAKKAVKAAKPVSRKVVTQPSGIKSISETLNLDDCIDIAIERNAMIRIAKEEIKLATLKVQDAKRELFPKATTKTALTTGQAYGVDFEERSYGVSVEQPLYSGGKLKATLKQAKINLDIAEKKLNKQIADVSYKIAEAYYNLATQLNNIKTAESLMEEASFYMESATKRFDAGLSTKQEFLNVKSQVSQSQFQYESAKKEALLANLALLQAMDVESDNPLNIITELEYKKFDIDLDKCLQTAFDNRVEVKIDELLVKYNLLEKKIARGRSDFKVDIAGFLGRSGSAYTTETLDMTEDWNVGLKVSKPWLGNTANYSFTKEITSKKVGWKDRTEGTTNSFEVGILDALGNRTEQQQSVIGFEKSQSDLLEAKQSVFYEVKESYFGFQKSELQLEDAKTKTEFRKEELKVVKAQAELNEALGSQVLDVRIKLAGEETFYNQARSNFYLAIAKINKAVGIRNYFK